MRDRDARGRPQNARPRDASGRPLRPGTAGVDRVDESVVLPPARALAEAQRLLDAGFPFHAHEVLEGAWKAAPAPERPFWQGLAQIAVGLTHLQRGNARGAVALLRRGADTVADRPPGADRHGVDVDAVVGWARRRAGDVADHDPADLPPAGPVPLVSAAGAVGKPSTSHVEEEHRWRTS